MDCCLSATVALSASEINLDSTDELRTCKRGENAYRPVVNRGKDNNSMTSEERALVSLNWGKG